jgi:hypothetical protein
MEPVNQPPGISTETQTENPQTNVLKPAFDNKPVSAGGGKRWGIIVAVGLLIVTVSEPGYLGLSIERPKKKLSASGYPPADSQTHSRTW